MENPSKGRETFVTLAMIVVLGGALFFFLNLVSLGIFFWVLVALVALVLLGLVHYLMWGQALSQEVAIEREEQMIRDQMEAEAYADMDADERS